MPVPTRLFLACIALLTACTPAIGDKCTTDTKCGTSLTCDLATPEGYCTKTPCRAGECPPEATCVDFGAEQRYCMMICDADVTCREGLECRSTSLCGPDAPTPTSAGPCGMEAGASATVGKSFCGVPR